ncbi:MAG: mobile mystery protein B [Alphaproteobacteria bacterium]|nr:mobile mystery protein B [Alphaproteobacteria bacterium]
MSERPFDPDDDAEIPLDPDERRQLVPTYISTRPQLNEAEQIGVTEADDWAFRRRRNVLDERFLLNLHRRMFGKVWKWAGTLRTTERNIGVEAYRIGVELRASLDDARYWIAKATFSSDEIAVRFHHRLVWIHPFPNGNGRHARLSADLLAVSLGRPRFTWGNASLVEAVATRAQYVAALKAADAHDMAPLLAFARS